MKKFKLSKSAKDKLFVSFIMGLLYGGWIMLVAVFAGCIRWYAENYQFLIENESITYLCRIGIFVLAMVVLVLYNEITNLGDKFWKKYFFKKDSEEDGK